MYADTPAEVAIIARDQYGNVKEDRSDSFMVSFSPDIKAAATGGSFGAIGACFANSISVCQSVS